MLSLVLTISILAHAPSTPSPATPTLAQRTAAVREATQVAPTLVIVKDDASFAAALARWHTKEHGRLLYPILYDLNTQQSREDIARFVRAFKPERTVRYTATQGETPYTLTTEQGLKATLAATFGAVDEQAYLAALDARAESKGPLGAVVTAPDEPAAPAALALAAAYGQILITAPSPAPSRGTITIAAADALSNAITARLSALGIPHAALNDQIDTLTLCFDTPARVIAGRQDAPTQPIAQLTAKPGEALALTDLVGRVTSGSRDKRWAYASQITGNNAQATYRAMCAIFLRPHTATTFNGYDDIGSGEFAKYDHANALRTLAAAGLVTHTAQTPTRSAADWRAWAAAGFTPARRWPSSAGAQPDRGTIDTQFLMVNTMGNADFFQFKQGLCHPGDLPFLHTPVALSFIHSWSLQHTGEPSYLGGRWLDRGVYVYVGSVHEPYLSAFVTPDDLTTRLVAGTPIAIAARHAPDARPPSPFSAPWRVAVLGDALWSLNPPLKRVSTPAPLTGTSDLAADLAPFLKDRRYAHALDTLAMLNRDSDAARLAAAALADEPDKVDIHAALRAVMVAYRAKDIDTLVKAAACIDLPGEREIAVADAIWHALRPRTGTLTQEQAALLGRTLRPSSYAYDAADAARAINAASGNPAARAFLQQAKSKAPREDLKRRIDELADDLVRP